MLDGKRANPEDHAMTSLPDAIRILPSAEGAFDSVSLTYEERLLRRKRLRTDGGAHVLVDLPQVASLEGGEALELADGRRIAVIAAPEPVLTVTGDLPRLAWHIGNRHMPCEIHADRLVIRADNVLARMLSGLGAAVQAGEAPFRPESGAYGTGRTLGHDHGQDRGHAHSHSHAPGQVHAQTHGHSHAHSHVHFHGAHFHDDTPDPVDEPE